MIEYEILTYQKFVVACKEIAKQIPKNIKNIYGIPRGGLVPAVYISHMSGLPVVEKEDITEKTMIIDDISDTGETLAIFNNYKIATIYYHKQSITLPDIWIYEKKDKWIQFPWETK